MLIVKKIHNNVAMARDAQGNDLVVFGKGVGFPKTPYVLDDESVIQGVFQNVSSGILSMTRSIPDDIMGVSLEIIALAHQELTCALNPNVFLTLADHLQFAVERARGGYHVENPLSGTVEYVYPKEYEIGKRGLAIFATRMGVLLPESEACSIAMHIVNSECGDGEANDMDEVMRTLTAIDAVTEIIERRIGITIDRNEYNYARFTAHVRYLIKRLMNDSAANTPNRELFARIARDFPEIRACAEEICVYLQDRYGCACGDEEKLYLMMYINRFLANR